MDETVGSMSSRRLTDESVFTELSNKGFCFLPSYLPSEQVKILAAAARRLHSPWSDLPPEQLPPSGTLPAPNAFPSKSAGFPFEETCLNHAIVAPDKTLARDRTNLHAWKRLLCSLPGICGWYGSTRGRILATSNKECKS